MSISSVSNNQSVYYLSSTQNTATTETTKTDNTTQTTGASSVDATVSTKWGFKVDSNGFFGADFNKAAGIPENLKIHQGMMEMVESYTNLVNPETDALTAMSKIWNVYKTVAGNTLDSDGYMTLEQVKAMPKSFVSKGSLLDGISSVQNSESESDKLSQLQGDISSISNGKLCIGRGVFNGAQVMYCDDISTIGKGYEDIYGINYNSSAAHNNEVSIGELFGEFIYSNADINSGNSEQVKQEVEGARNYNTFLESGQDLKSYLQNNGNQKELNEFMKYVGTMPDGNYSQSLVDTFFEELDKSLKEQRAQLTQNKYPELEPTKQDTKTTKAVYPSSSPIAKLTSGSLISVGA